MAIGKIITTIFGKGNKYANPIWNSIKSGTRNYGNFCFGTQADDMSKILRENVKAQGLNNFGKNFKNAYNTTKPPVKGFKEWCSHTWNKSLRPKSWARDWKAASIKDGRKWMQKTKKALSERSFFSKTWGKIKLPFKTLGKRMPLIGNVLLIAFELPNIISAFRHGDENGKHKIWTGIKEIGKAALKIGAFALGTVVGTAIGGPLGGILGGLALNMLACKLLPGHKEKREEQAAQEQTAQNPQEQMQQGQNPQQSMVANEAYNPTNTNNSAITPENYQQYLAQNTNASPNSVWSGQGNYQNTSTNNNQMCAFDFGNMASNYENYGSFDMNNSNNFRIPTSPFTTENMSTNMMLYNA